MKPMTVRIAKDLEKYVKTLGEYDGIVYADLARVALVAMMDPTPKMLGEAAKAMSPGKRPTQEWVSVQDKHKIRYQAMIRKALEE